MFSSMHSRLDEFADISGPYQLDELLKPEFEFKITVDLLQSLLVFGTPRQTVLGLASSQTIFYPTTFDELSHINQILNTLFLGQLLS